MKSSDVVAKLTALAQESRLAIFRLLVTAGPEGSTPGHIAERLELAPATLSFHLKELSRAGLISARQEGRFLHYSADFRAMNDVLVYLTENCCAGLACGPVARVRAPARRSSPRRKEKS